MQNRTTGPRGEPGPGDWLDKGDFADIVRLTPLISIDLVVRDPAGRILVGLRTNEPARGWFFVPGGRITKNERLSDAFRRISQAELGTALDMSEGRFLGVYEHFYDRNRLGLPGFGTHYVVLAYESRLAAAPAYLPADQHGEYRWLTAEALLAAADVHENTKAYFRTPTGHGHAETPVAETR